MTISKLYLNITFTGMVITLLPWMLKNKRFIAELKRSSYRPFVGSAFICSAYGVVLAAMELAPVSYVVSARATGIVLSALAGIFFFKEEVGPSRWISLILITIGIIFLSLS